jgi:CO dehydrogenase maturation factor
MEAGIEHLGRGTAEHVDILLAVTDANLKSLETAANLCRLARESGIRVVGLIANRIADERQAEAVRQFAEEQHLTVIAQIPFDPLVADTGMTGEPLDRTSSRAVRAISDLGKHLWELT